MCSQPGSWLDVKAIDEAQWIARTFHIRTLLFVHIAYKFDFFFFVEWDIFSMLCHLLWSWTHMTPLADLSQQELEEKQSSCSVKSCESWPLYGDSAPAMQVLQYISGLIQQVSLASCFTSLTGEAGQTESLLSKVLRFQKLSAWKNNVNLKK